MKLFRLTALILALLVVFSACGRASGGQILKYDIPTGVQNLDPQFATDSIARMIIQNSFEGLYHQLPAGDVEPCLAARHEVSADGLTHTFSLRRDARWNGPALSKADRALYGGQPVTAHDFAFAFARLFDPNAPSPFAEQLAAIKNAMLVANGTVPQESLGVRALNDYTLEITLTRPEPVLPELLASSFAMPCNETFFRATRARYGLDLQNMLFNGPFTVNGWDNTSALSLRRNALYPNPPAQPTAIGGVNLYPQSSPADAQERFRTGVTDAYKVDYGTYRATIDAGGTGESFEDVVWVLVLNCRRPALANADLRRALAYAVDRALFVPHLPDSLRTTEVLIPPAVGTLGQSFRSFAGEDSELLYSPHLAKQYNAFGLRDLAAGDDPLVYEKIPLDEILVPDRDSLPLLAGYVQQGWQKNLAVYTGLRRLPEQEILAKVYAGDFQAAILPISASYSSPDAILSQFLSSAAQSFSGYESTEFDALFNVAAAPAAKSSYEHWITAEEFLLLDAPVIPLFFETSYYAMSPGVSGVAFSPFLSGISFKDACKE